LQGEKDLYFKADIQFIEVAKYDEVSVKQLYVELKNDKTFQRYFCD
jgi:hypothetical protein